MVLAIIVINVPTSERVACQPDIGSRVNVNTQQPKNFLCDGVRCLRDSFAALDGASFARRGWRWFGPVASIRRRSPGRWERGKTASEPGSVSVATRQGAY